MKGLTPEERAYLREAAKPLDCASLTWDTPAEEVVAEALTERGLLVDVDCADDHSHSHATPLGHLALRVCERVDALGGVS
jgi:hypothetical protein